MISAPIPIAFGSSAWGTKGYKCKVCFKTSVIKQVNLAKVEIPIYRYFRLGYCGGDEEIKALTLVAIGAAESLFN